MQRWGHEPPIEETALPQGTCGNRENDLGGLSGDEISVKGWNFDTSEGKSS